MTRGIAVLVSMLAITAATTACSGGGMSAGSITVYAASSLSGAFSDLGDMFEQGHPGTAVRFNFAGSSTLAAQILEDAPADVFAAADSTTMNTVVEANALTNSPRIFAQNRLEIIVAKGNPKSIVDLADLGRADVATVLCAPSVPCGRYARQVLDRAGVDVDSRSDETSVSGVLGRVASGEADAGIVYVTDAFADGRVDGVAIPVEENVTAQYQVGVLKESGNRALAEAFVELLLSDAGRQVLARYRFLAT